MKSGRTGCGLLLVTVLVTCLLLAFNRFLVVSLYQILIPTDVEYPRARTMLQFLLMIGLLIPEWWLIDKVVVTFQGLARGPVQDDGRDRAE